MHHLNGVLDNPNTYNLLHYPFSMVIDSSSKPAVSPSLVIAYQYFKVALEDFASDDVIRQRDGCEKAYRAATEAVDVLLAWHGVIIPAGKPEAHIIRGEALTKWGNMDFRIDSLSYHYSRFKDQLHGLCFYGSANPKNFEKLIHKVKDFINDISKFVSTE